MFSASIKMITIVNLCVSGNRKGISIHFAGRWHINHLRTGPGSGLGSEFVFTLSRYLLNKLKSKVRLIFWHFSSEISIKYQNRFSLKTACLLFIAINWQPMDANCRLSVRVEFWGEKEKGDNDDDEIGIIILFTFWSSSPPIVVKKSYSND